VKRRESKMGTVSRNGNGGYTRGVEVDGYLFFSKRFLIYEGREREREGETLIYMS
jgi:hypothetical protein